jgi:CelD/BcsL family acetyltransferase involved in cellulose biosynthesis
MECWEQSVCPYIVLTRDLAQTMDQRGKDLKREIRKNNLRLEDLGKVSFSRSITHEQVDDLIRTATFVDEKSHKFEAGKTLFTQHENREFLRHISQAFAKRRWLDFATLELDDVPIAYEFHFRYKEKVFAYTGSYDDGYADFSPGIGILYRLVQNSIDLGLKEYDLLQGGHTYKWKWTSKGRKQYQIMIINDTYYARMFHYLKFKTRSPREDGMEESGISGEPSSG